MNLNIKSDDFKWRNFLTGRDDATLFNVSFLSKPAEWHAVAVGFVIAAPTGPLFDTAAAGWGLKQYLEHMARKADDGLHYKDALNEPAYFALGFGIGGLVAVASGRPFPGVP